MIILVKLFVSCLEINISRRKANYVNATPLPLFLLEPHLSHYVFSISSHPNITEMNRYNRFTEKCPEQTEEWISTLWKPLLLFSCTLSMKIKVVYMSEKYPVILRVHRATSLQLTLYGKVLHSRLSSLQCIDIDTYTCIYVHTLVRSLAA